MDLYSDSYNSKTKVPNSFNSAHVSNQIKTRKRGFYSNHLTVF